MLTFVLSGLQGGWYLHRYSDGDITPIFENLPLEEAMKMTVKLAQGNRPCQVLKVTESGEYEALARFEE